MPIHSRSKIPITGWREYSNRVASPDEFRDTLDRTPTYNTGILTGGINRLAVIDVDGPVTTFPVTLPTTTVVETRKGFHYWYRIPLGIHLTTRIRLWPNVDLIAEQSYVLAPPSIKADHVRKFIHWIPFASIPDLPAEVIRLAQQRGQPGGGGKKKPPSVRTILGVYGEAALDNELRRLRQIPREPGNGKNDAMNRSAFRMGQLVGRGYLDHDNAFDALLAIWMDVWLKPEHEGRSTINSGLRGGISKSHHRR